MDKERESIDADGGGGGELGQVLPFFTKSAIVSQMELPLPEHCIFGVFEPGG